MPVLLATLYPYKLEFEATVTHINDDGTVEFDQTYFYPTGGGQPYDLGVVRRNDEEFQITEVKKIENRIVHSVNKVGLVEGDLVHCSIDAARREKHRRMHTACHVLCAVLEKEEHAKITGNQIGVERTRIDFSTEHFSPEKMQHYIDEANQAIAQNIVVKKFTTTRDAILQNPALVKLAVGFPENIHEVHMVEIMNFDTQPCSGTHVDNTAEIGKLVFEKAESKGKNNRRVYFSLA